MLFLEIVLHMTDYITENSMLESQICPSHQWNGNLYNDNIPSKRGPRDIQEGEKHKNDNYKMMCGNTVSQPFNQTSNKTDN